jgi:hypothetical protein
VPWKLIISEKTSQHGRNNPPTKWRDQFLSLKQRVRILKGMTPQSTARFVGLNLLALGLLQAQGGWWDTRFDLPGANGRIQSLVEFRGALYAVGYFTRIAGVKAPGVARWDGTRWVAITPGLNASVGAAVATDNALYFAAFQRQTNQPTGLLRWDGQTWIALGTPPGFRDVLGDPLVANGSDIYAEVFPDTSIGGPYWTLAAAKWDGHAWTVLANTRYVGANSLNGLALAQGDLYASGGLINADPQSNLNLGRLERGAWVPVGGGVGEGLSVFDIASDGLNLFVQGSFRTVDSKPADGYAIWDGGQWIVPSAASRDGSRVVALTSNPGEVLASEMAAANAPGDQYLVRYAGTNRTVLARGDAPGMRLMRRTRDGIYATGEFRDVGGVRTGNLALWTGDHWAPVGPGGFHGFTDEATTLAIAGTNVYAAGAFHYAGSSAANHIARWDGRSWHPLGSGIEGSIAQIAARGTDLFVAGAFTSAGGVVATNVTRWDGAAWSNLGDGLTGRLMAIAVSDSYVWVARGAPSGFVVSRWNGNAWSDIATGAFAYGEILALLATDESVLVGGTFARINGIEVNNIAKWEAGQWHALERGLTGQGPWMPNDYPFTQVRALLRDGSNLYVGGSFTNAGSVPAMNVARWDGTKWSALGDGIPGFGSCLFGSCVYPVTSLAMVQGQLFAGGGYTTGPGTEPQGFLARWNGTSWANAVDEGWTLDQGQPYRYENQLHVWALAARGNDLYLAGNFASIGGIPSYGFGIWHDSAPLTVKAHLRAGHLVLSCAREFQTAVIETTDSLTSPTWSSILDVKFTASQNEPNQVEAELTPSLSPSFYRLRLE